MKSDKESLQVCSNVHSQSSSSAQATGVWSSFTNSFRPALPQPAIDTLLDDESLDEIQRANIRAANSPLSRSLKPRHLQMIAIGGSIGSGLFVGSGSALTNGPAAIIIAWVITASSMYTTMQGLGELVCTFPISGGFNIYASRFIEPGVGFAVGWNYFMQFFVLLPLELVAASITIKYWNKDLNSDIFVAIFWVTVFLITMLGVKWYGEAEFIFCTVKVITVIGFIILGIVLICGGGPNHDFIGGKYWRNPGPFADGFKGVASVFITAAFSFGGTEMIGLAGSEAKNPGKSLSRSIKQVFWRICIFYLGSITVISCLVPYTDSRLLGSSSVDATASPFVISIVNSGIKGLPSVINAVILISVLSVGNASVYACSRSLNSLAEQGMAPKWAGYIDRKGRPLFAIIITNVFGLFAFIAASDKQEDAFDWLLALSGLSSIFTWISINLSHVRFRRAMKTQGKSLEDLNFKSQVGVLGSYYGLIVNVLVLIAQFWIALFPQGGSPNAYDFFISYLGMPVILISWVGYKIWKKNIKLFIRSKDIDLDTGRLHVDQDLVEQERAEEKALLESKPLYYRLYRAWC